MAKLENPDSCAICEAELPENPPNVTIPTSFAPRMTPLAGPGVRRVAFCSERHRRDWLDAYRGMFPETNADPDADD
jgi:hypothetical protein